MSFASKWINLIYEVATGSWRTRLILAPIAAAFYLSFIASFVLLSFIVDQSLRLPKAVWNPWSLRVGICLLLYSDYS